MTTLISLIYAATALFWIGLTLQTGHTDSTAGLYLQILLFVVPFLGALVGFAHAMKWGGLKSAVGKGVFFISLGTLFWSLGMLMWNYYIFIAAVEIPYPSLADAFFILSWPFWAIGVLNLSKATGVRYALKAMGGKLMTVVIPVIAIAASYYLLVVVARGGVIELDPTSAWKVFFDLFYPIGSAVILALTLTFVSLSGSFLGGRYRTPIIILVCAFLVNYFADFLFSWTTTNETYFNGHFVDFLFVTAMYLFALSLSLFAPPAEVPQKQQNTI